MNVFNALIKRFEFLVDNFDNFSISFSGGKDSTILTHLFIKFIKDNNLNIKPALFHIDYEAQYKFTTEFVNEIYSTYINDVIPYHCCLPIRAGCSTSMHQMSWIPWNKDEIDIWVRPLPNEPYIINEDNHNFDFFYKGIWDYDFQKEFGLWFHKNQKATRTAVLVGIRTEESLNRWRAIHSERNNNKFQNIQWLQQMYDNVFNAYPIFDWKLSDVWLAFYKFNLRYNKLYDLFYQANVPFHKMRVASPFHSYATDSLHLYKAIDPYTWGKMVGRVNGANFTAIYGNTWAMGWKHIKLPKGMTWREFALFLLGTLPPKTRKHYEAKLHKSIEFWKSQGGVLSDETIDLLRQKNVNFEVKSSNRSKKKSVIMEYIDDFEPIPEFNLLPTWKRFAICVLKNDHYCKYMGFSVTKQEQQRKKEILNKYRSIL